MIENHARKSEGWCPSTKHVFAGRAILFPKAGSNRLPKGGSDATFSKRSVVALIEAFLATFARLDMSSMQGGLVSYQDIPLVLMTG